jgi:hypothetical protein
VGYSSIITEQDFSEIKTLLNKARDSKLSEEEHNKMLAYGVKYPNSASVQVYLMMLDKKEKCQCISIAN